MDVLIDRTGEIWDPRSGTLRRHFMAPISTNALPDYLIRNLGFVGLSIDNGSAFVRGRPGHISYAAYSVAVGLIEAEPVRRIALKWFDGSWHDEPYFGTNVEDAKKRLLALMFEKRQLGRHYLSFPRELDTLIETHPHSRLFDYWRSVQGCIDPEESSETLYELTGGKFLTIGKMNNGRLKFTSIGRGLIVYRDQSWTVQFSGGPVEEQPDYNFGAWIVAGYREAFTRSQPCLSDFDTVVHDARNQSTQHHSYTRLLLPIRTKTGELQLLSAPRAETSIDLTLKVLQKIS